MVDGLIDWLKANWQWLVLAGVAINAWMVAYLFELRRAHNSLAFRYFKLEKAMLSLTRAHNTSTTHSQFIDRWASEHASKKDDACGDRIRVDDFIQAMKGEWD